MPLLRIRDVGRNITTTYYSGDYDESEIVHPGDLIIGMDGEFNCSRWQGQPSLMNQRVCRVTLTSPVLTEGFLDLALPGYLAAINEATPSVTVKHLSSKSVGEILLPLPPPR